MITGFGGTIRNIGKINNSGVEISLAGDILRKEDFRWSANFNTSFLSSKVKELYGGQDQIWSDPTGGDARVSFIYRENSPVYSYYLREWAGVDKTNGKPVWYVNDPSNPDGDFLYNGRGASNSVAKAKQILIGSPIPKAYGGFGTEAEYKGVSLGLSFNYKIGGDLYDAGSKDVAEDGYYWERIRSAHGIQQVWRPDFTEGVLPKVSGNDPEDGISNSTRHLYDASFLRLKQVTLAYRLPEALTQRAKISNARIFFNGTNLLTFSKFVSRSGGESVWFPRLGNPIWENLYLRFRV